MSASNGVPDFKDTKTEGFVEVVKDWVGGKLSYVIPDMGISVGIPTKNRLGYTVTFNDTFYGVESTDVIYNKSGSVVYGSVPEMECGSDKEFSGWSTRDNNVVNVTIDSYGSLSSEIFDGMNLYACYRQIKPKYSVSLYDIGKDVDNNGKAVGCTFGPTMWGIDCINTYINHEPAGYTTDGNEHRCIHDDEWSTICSNNKVDPYIYEQCIENRCTKGIILNTEGTTFDQGKEIPYIVRGDGTASLTRAEIGVSGVVYKHVSKSDMNYTCSRVRAVLNGADEYTKVGSAYDLDELEFPETYKASSFTDKNCLFNTLPDELKNNISRTKIVFEDGRREPGYKQGTRVYDRLWLMEWNDIRNRYAYFPGEDSTVHISNHFTSVNKNITLMHRNTYLSPTGTDFAGLGASGGVHRLDRYSTEVGVSPLFSLER